MSCLRPLLFENLTGEGMATIDQSEEYHRKAHRVIGAGYHFAIRARPNKRFELTVRNAEDEPISLATCGELGIELHAAAELLIDHAYRVLFDPLPW
jgi:hypothetical protein